MPITSSTHTLGTVQVDGRRWVTEDHTDNLERHHFVEYLAAVGADYVAIRTGRAAQINLQLADQELQNIVNGLLSAASPNEMSKAVLAERMRDLLRQYTGLELCRLSARVLATITSGEITDAEWRTAFGLTVNQWNNVKSQLQAWSDALTVVNAAKSTF
jgi:hypothetical protein